MADKKISQLTEHITPVLGTDLLPMVGNTANTPANFKVQVKNFISQIILDFPQTTFSALKITANVSANANAATLAGGDISIVANSSIGATILNFIGFKSAAILQNGNCNITGQLWGAHIKLDPGNSAFVSSNTFGLVIEHTLDTGVAASRAGSPRAYLAIKEKAGAGSNTTLYLMDIGAQGNVVSQDLANVNSSVVFSKANTTSATHKLKISVDGVDYWLLVANTV